MKVLFVCSGNKEKGISPIIKVQGQSLIKNNAKLDYFPIKGTGVKGYLKNLFPLRKKIKNWNYDIVHAHNGESILLSLLCFKKNKFFISFMGDDLLGSLNNNFRYTLKSRVFSLIYKIIAKYFADGVIVKSMKMQNRLFKGTRSLIIPNGVDTNLFYPVKVKENKNEKIILVAYNPNRIVKNYKLLDEAIKYLNDDSIKIKIIYNDSQEKLMLNYNRCDVLVLTSLHEGSPNIIKEAMACNCPIVSTNVGDVEWVLGNTDGCYISSFDFKDVAKKVNLALKFSKLNSRTIGRKRIFDLELDLNSIANKILFNYRKAICS